MLFALLAQGPWELRHLGGKLDFLNDEIKEEIFVRQIEEYVEEGKEDWVLKLKNAMNGLK